jgi:hypothetical protein
LELWKSTGNILSWLFRKFLADENVVISTWSIGDDGLNRGIAENICATTFKNDIAHMTLEIASPRVLEVVRDIKVTFPDKLGTIGNIIILELSYVLRKCWCEVKQLSLLLV